GNTVYVGSSSGGLWKSINGLRGTPAPNFQLLSDQTRTLSVGAVAVDNSTNPPTIFVGTGAPDNSANLASYNGAGIFFTRNNGGQWTIVDSADGGKHPFAGLGFSSIVVDPTDSQILLASTGIGVDPNFPYASLPQGDGAYQHLGIYRSTNAGRSW